MARSVSRTAQTPPNSAFSSSRNNQSRNEGTKLRPYSHPHFTNLSISNCTNESRIAIINAPTHAYRKNWVQKRPNRSAMPPGSFTISNT
ncbi:MAG: hypothetical protein IJ929_09365 [Prevotella sp.]|nr:hypothetical protein [Prevotella sp.]